LIITARTSYSPKGVAPWGGGEGKGDCSGCGHSAPFIADLLSLAAAGIPRRVAAALPARGTVLAALGARLLA